MSFIVRAVRSDDISQVIDLAKQFNLLNLPGEKKAVTSKVEKLMMLADFCG